AAFSNCPYQYRFAHILKIPGRGKAQFSFGKTMHSALQKIFVLLEERRGFKQSNLFSENDGKNVSKKNILTMEEILKIYEESWIDDWYENKQEKEEYRKKGKEILKNFYEKHKDNWPTAVFLEKGFNFKIRVDGELYTVRGVMDRIDEKEKKIKIVDYKTGSPKDKLTFDDKYQLLIYQLAAHNLFRQEIDSLSFYYLHDNSEVEFLGNEKELEKTEEKIAETISAIKKGEFSPKPSVLCKFCDFFNICEFRKN
ncbi:MAG: PD-(D/E)XK nuclease family protein, partial [Patescibacteria group bacterium]